MIGVDETMLLLWTESWSGNELPPDVLLVDDTSGTDAAAPGSPAAGDIVYDSVNNLFCGYNGSAWVSFSGAGTCWAVDGGREGWGYSVALRRRL
ncbi:MAG: hypothetical protein BWX64_00729 [Acidobacteria bacterium ADurb.Bin051]|nr:MAG: hypothetical protein BWX64_00729 [Acidobacteria bacterium ADurb.Bin051]